MVTRLIALACEKIYLIGAIVNSAIKKLCSVGFPIIQISIIQSGSNRCNYQIYHCFRKILIQNKV